MSGMIVKKPPKRGEEKNKASGIFGRKLEGLLYLTSFLTLAFLALSIFTFTRPLSGLGVVSGYTVTSVVYTLNGTNSSTLDSVAFDVGAAASQVKVQLVATTGSWYACTLGTGTTWSCTTTGLAVSAIDQLRGVAASN